MLKKFLFYFAFFLCSSGLLCRCTKKISGEDETKSLSNVRWLPAQTFSNASSEFSLQTLLKDGLFRLSDGGFQSDFVPRLVQAVTWNTKKQVEFTLAGDTPGLSAAEVVEGIRLGFQSSDGLLVESLSELIQNGREYAQGRIPFSSVGVRANGSQKVVLNLRRHAPALLGMVLSHPGTWPVAKNIMGPLEVTSREIKGERILAKNPKYPSGSVRLESLLARHIEDAYTRTSLVLNGEADFTSDISPALISTARKTDRLQERFSSWRLFLVINPSRSPLRYSRFREELAHSIDPRELARFVPAFTPVNRLLERRPSPQKVGWFASLEPRADRRALSQETGSLRLRPTMPYPQTEALPLLMDAATNLSAQLGKFGVNVEIISPSFQSPTAESLAEPELTLIYLPALPLASTAWSEVFSFLSRKTNSEEMEKTLGEWDHTRDDERLEVAMEGYLSEREAVLVPLGAHRRSFLSSPRLQAIQLSPFGFWDWTKVALR